MAPSGCLVSGKINVRSRGCPLRRRGDVVDSSLHSHLFSRHDALFPARLLRARPSRAAVASLACDGARGRSLLTDVAKRDLNVQSRAVAARRASRGSAWAAISRQISGRFQRSSTRSRHARSQERREHRPKRPTPRAARRQPTGCRPCSATSWCTHSKPKTLAPYHPPPPLPSAAAVAAGDGWSQAARRCTARCTRRA